MQAKEQKHFRCFVSRHYIAVEYYDVTATTAKKARKLAEKVAQIQQPDPRLTATDNRWHSDEPVELERIGYGGANGEHTAKVAMLLEDKRFSTARFMKRKSPSANWSKTKKAFMNTGHKRKHTSRCNTLIGLTSNDGEESHDQ